MDLNASYCAMLMGDIQNVCAKVGLSARVVIVWIFKILLMCTYLCIISSVIGCILNLC
jgi:hypothetical protein